MTITTILRPRGLMFAAALGCASAASAQEHLPKRLYATDLGTLGGQRAEARAINDAGLIVGMDTEGRTARSPITAFVVPPDGKMIGLEGRRGAVDVNERGMVVGTTVGSASRIRPFLWTASDGFRDLPAVTARRVAGVAIDRAGMIAVTSDTYPEPVQTWVCDPPRNACTVLPGKPGLSAIALGMSPSGAVVGFLGEVIERGPDEPNIVNEYPIFWDAGSRQLHELPVLREADGTEWKGEATDMNDAGTIVGTLWHAGSVRAVAWVGPDHQLRDLGDGRANAINAHDVVVGGVPHPLKAADEVPRYRAHLWDLRRKTALDFTGLAEAPEDVFDAEATDINDRGVAVGRLATTADGWGGSHAVVFDRYAPEDGEVAPAPASSSPSSTSVPAAPACVLPADCESVPLTFLTLDACCTATTACGLKVTGAPPELRETIASALELGDGETCAPRDRFFIKHAGSEDLRIETDEGKEILLSTGCDTASILSISFIGCCMPNNHCGVSTYGIWDTLNVLAPGEPFSKLQCVSSKELNAQLADSKLRGLRFLPDTDKSCDYAALDAQLPPVEYFSRSR
jgi:hypothetical protein